MDADIKNKQNTKHKITVGYSFGHLVVTEATGMRKNGYTVWKCVCECGNEICLDTRYIQRQTITDCGCFTATTPGQVDVTGMRYGRLVCLYPTEDRDSNGNRCGIVSVTAEIPVQHRSVL